MCEFSVAQNLMSLIAEGDANDDSEEADMLLRQTAVELFVTLLQEKNESLSSLPRILLETMAWCLGEYAYLSAVSTLDDVLNRLCLLLTKSNVQFPMTTRQTILQAILKLVAQAGTCPAVAAVVIDEGTRSSNADLQTRCLEFQGLLTACPELLPEILPVDASAEDVDVDMNLSFLDSYVQTALANGARPYEKPEDDDDDEDLDGSGRAGGTNGYYTPSGAASAFNMTPYEKPQQPSSLSMMNMSGMGRDSQRTPNQGVSLPPGAAAGGPAGAGGGGPEPAQAPMDAGGGAGAGGGGLALNTRHVANVWGRGGLNTGGAAGAAPAPTAPAPSAATNSAWDTGGTSGSTSSAYGGTGAAAAAQAPAAPAEQPKTAAQLEKERMAAAFFGGIVPGAAPVAAPPPPKPPAAPAAPAAPAPAAAAAPPPPAPAAPAAEIDLLDMGAWDAPAPAAAAATTTPAAEPPTPATDVFAPTAAEPAAAAPAVVETVSEDYDENPMSGGSPAAPAPPPDAAPEPPAAPAPMDDPFAGAGLLGDVSDAPLATLSASNPSKFEFNGTPMAPFPINTAQFGQQWAACKATSPGSVTSTKVTTLAQFMDLVQSVVGAHPVEAIAATNEGICAGMIGGGSQYALIHAKLTVLATGGGTKIDLTVKSTDASLGGSLAMYMQTMLR